MAFPADLLDALREADLTPLAPKAWSTSTSTRRRSPARHGSARVEGLGRAHSTLRCGRRLARPTWSSSRSIDLSDRVRSTAYEHPESLKERVHLTTVGDYWPYATSTSRNVDYDHPTPQ